MGQRELLLPWGGQPSEAVRVNRENRFGASMLFAVVGNNPTRDIVSGRAGEPVALAASISGPFGVGVSTTRSASPRSVINFGPHDLGITNTTELTFFAVYNESASATERAVAVGLRDPTTAEKAWLALNANSSGTAASGSATFLSTTAGSLNRGLAVSSVVDGQWHCLAIYKESQANSNYLYGFDGAGFSATGSNSTTSPISATQEIVLAGSSLETFGLKSGLAFAGIMRGVWTAADLADFTGNPWQTIEPQRIWVPVLAGGGGGTTHTVDLTESVSATDAASSSLTAALSITESASAADVLAAVLQAVASLTEAASATETQTAARTQAAAASEAASATDAQSAVNTAVAAVAEAATATDLAAAVNLAVAAVSEAIAATEAQSTSPIVSAALTEAASAADSSAVIATLAAALSESASAADAITAAALLVSTLLESVNATDASTTAAQLVALLTESVSLADAQSTDPGTTHYVSIDELAVALDLVAAALVGQRVLSAPPLGQRLAGSQRASRLSLTARLGRTSSRTR